MPVPEGLVKVIDSYLPHRSFRVMMDGATLEWRPMLYNLYTSDIAKSVQTELAVYADHICIYAKNKNLQYALDRDRWIEVLTAARAQNGL